MPDTTKHRTGTRSQEEEKGGEEEEEEKRRRRRGRSRRSRRRMRGRSRKRKRRREFVQPPLFFFKVCAAQKWNTGDWAYTVEKLEKMFLHICITSVGQI